MSCLHWGSGHDEGQGLIIKVHKQTLGHDGHVILIVVVSSLVSKLSKSSVLNMGSLFNANS